jgi:hypothetical protein
VSEFDGILAEEAALPEFDHLLIPAIAHLLRFLRQFLCMLRYVDLDAELVLH